MNLAMIFKMLGIKVPPETVAQLEVIIPQIPSKVNEVLKVNSEALQNFDQRLHVIEQALLMLIEQFQALRKETHERTELERIGESGGHSQYN